MSSGRRRRQDVGELIALLVQIVDGVRVVPDQPEVRRGGLHARQPHDHGVARGRAGRIAVLRHEPHAA